MDAESIAALLIVVLAGIIAAAMFSGAEDGDEW